MTHASVFSGIGGPEVAAAMLGWENIFHCEINPFGRAVLEYWFPNAKSYEDITTTDFSEWGGKVNVLTGGFPCQPFSRAGKRRGADDDRYLWPFMHRCINQVRPDWVVCENVGGILTMVERGRVAEMAVEKSLFDEGDTLYRYRLEETFTLERICNDLEGDGYAVQAVVIPACAVNAPHRRDRVFIIGHRNDITNPDCDGLCARRSSGRIWAQMDGRSVDKPLNGFERFSAPQPTPDTTDEGLQRRYDCDKTGHKQSKAGRVGFMCEIHGRTRSDTNSRACRGLCRNTDIAGLGRWDTFPTQSPVCRGNDGIPYRLVDLAIPPSKWRTESLKAYGNAIVPQVMYEIFRAIESTY